MKSLLLLLVLLVHILSSSVNTPSLPGIYTCTSLNRVALESPFVALVDDSSFILQYCNTFSLSYKLLPDNGIKLIAPNSLGSKDCKRYPSQLQLLAAFTDVARFEKMENRISFQNALGVETVRFVSESLSNIPLQFLGGAINPGLEIQVSQNVYSQSTVTTKSEVTNTTTNLTITQNGGSPSNVNLPLPSGLLSVNPVPAQVPVAPETDSQAEKTIPGISKILVGSWKLGQVYSSRGPFTRNVLFNFTEDTISGRVCNSFNGKYTLTGLHEISFGPIASTLMFCYDTNPSEDKVLEGLSQSKYFNLKGNTLTFYDSTGTGVTLVLFKKV